MPSRPLSSQSASTLRSDPARGLAASRARREARGDLPLIVTTLVLAGVGLLMILSASAPVAQLELHNSLFYFQRQAVWALLGLLGLALGASVPLRLVRRLAKWGLLAAALLLLATHIPGIGVAELGASRWLRLGPVSIQPSELAKLALTVYAADLLARGQPGGWRLREFRQAILPVVGVLGLVLFEPDLGTTIVLGVTSYALFFCAGFRLLPMLAVAGAGIAGVLYHSWNTPYQRARWLGFLDPWADPQGKGFQLVQSLLAIGSGGVTGAGWGQGKQKLFWLPIQYADFIFAVVAEELGLLGCAFVLGLFAVLAWRGFSIAGRAAEPFHALLAIGLTTTVVAQALINIGVVTASLPTTGIPLPFLSFGGTSLLTTLFAMGLVFNVSRQGARPGGASVPAGAS